METPGPHGQHLCLVPCGNYNLEEDHGDHLLPSEFIPLFSGFSPFGFIHFCFFFLTLNTAFIFRALGVT